MTKHHRFAAAAVFGALALLAPLGVAHAQADAIKVVLLGTGVGPPVNLQQYGASTLVEAGGQRLLFDCGRGATVRLAQAGIPIGSISRVFLTHLHHDVRQEGVVFNEDGLTVTAFLVDHGVVEPAFGYRVDYRGRSVVLSGDTRFSENLIRRAQGVDVLIHEVIDPDMLRTRPDRPSPAVVDSIIAHHTTPEQAGNVFRRVAPRLAVYSHAPNTARVLAQTRTTYSGPLQGAEDLLTIRIGDDIRVEHHPIHAPAAAGSPATP